jgi:hypothetical protein
MTALHIIAATFFTGSLVMATGGMAFTLLTHRARIVGALIGQGAN